MSAHFDNVPFYCDDFRIYYEADVCISEKHQILPHWHEHIEFAYFTEGSALVLCGDEKIEAVCGDFFIINSNEIHGFRPNGSGRALYHSIVLDSHFYSELNINLIALSFKTKITDDASVNSILRVIISEFKNMSAEYKQVIRYLLYSLIFLIIGKYANGGTRQRSPENSRSKLVKKVMVYLHENFNKPITLYELSQHTSYSADYISHAFAELTGQTVTSYLTEYRLRKARQYITSGSCNVTQAFASCGFSSLSYFNRQYKKCFGLSPSKDMPKT